MHLNILIGSLMVILTTVVHAAAMVGAVKGVRITHAGDLVREYRVARVVTIAALVLWMFLASIVESALWAGAYVVVNAIPSFDEAMYFSTVTYTTLGYGDVVLEENRRLLSALQAANGIIMFGWSTAIIAAAVHLAYFRSHPKPTATDP